MEVLLSFILSVQVGLSVYAVMKYREMLTKLDEKSAEIQATQLRLQQSIENTDGLNREVLKIEKDVQLLKIKSTLGAK